VPLAVSSLAPDKPNTVVVRREGTGYRLQAASASVAVANQFLEMLSIRGLSPATVRAYAFDLVVLYRWLDHAGLALDQLSPDDVVRFIEHQQRAGAQPKSINRRLLTCEQLYRFVTGGSMSQARLGGAPHYAGRGREQALGLHQRKRVARRKLRVKEPRRVVEPLTVDQVAALLRRLNRYRDVAIVHLMLLCGLRSMEVLSLRLNDLVLDDKRLRVRGKGNRERDLPLADLIADVIADYIRVERPPDAATERLFVVLQGSRRGRPMTSAGLRSLFRHRRKTSGELVQANPHRLRHTFGADMARAGVRLPILQRMMGHADGKTTLQYIQVSMADIALEYARAVMVIAKRYQETA
jgi:integrase/recombinase XerC